MIFDLQGNPLTDDEYRQRLLAWTMVLVKAAGGRLEIHKDLLEDHGHDGRTFLEQEFDQERQVLVLKVS